MKVKVNKELRAEPRVFGLSLALFLALFAVVGVSAGIVVQLGFGLIIPSGIIIVVAYIFFLKMSNNAHVRKMLTASDYIKFYEDTLNAK